MDTYFYYITCKGQQKGPYKFYQLQQLKTEELVNPEDFNPEEWEQFSQFVQTGEMPKASGRSGNTAFIRRADEKGEKDQPLLRYLTYAGYCVGLLFVIGGLIQGQSDYVLRAQPAFVLGALFTAALCQTFVKKTVRVRLERSAQMSTPRLLLWFVGGLAPMAFVIVLTSVVLQFVSPERQALEVGLKYLVTGAVLSLYWPFHYRTVAMDQHLPRQKSHSNFWLGVLIFFIGLLGFYVSPSAKSQTAWVSQSHEYLFSPAEAPVVDDGTWQFPIRLGDNLKNVQKNLGKPSDIIGREHVYDHASIRVVFNDRQRVVKLRLTRNENSPFYTTRILSGISPQMNLQEIQRRVQNAPVVFSEDETKTCIWDLQLYRVTACFWQKDISKNGKQYKEGELKWIEITPAG